MRNIKDCVRAFLPLLNTEYEIILGRKGIAVTLRIAFDFPEGQRNYTKNQASWTMLYKRKCNLSTGEEVVLYDRLKI